MKRVLGICLVMALLMGGVVPAAVADEGAVAPAYDLLSRYRYLDWVFSEDYSEVTVNGKTYPAGSILYREKNGNYVFWHWWNHYLLNEPWQQEYTPDEWYAQQVIPKVLDAIRRIASNYPDEEIVPIDGRPWQESEWADEYLALLPEDIREKAQDPTINGWLKEAAAMR